ncbi:MAG: 50S ribosomal protein L19e [Candidatus Micrarchaeia archaeon]
MSLRTIRRLAADILKCGESRVYINPERLQDVASALTRDDVKALIMQKVIRKLPKKGVSRYRGRLNDLRTREGRTGEGSIKGRKNDYKKRWMSKVRSQRKYLKQIKSTIQKSAYRMLYNKVKGGEFKSRSQLMAYVKENNLMK